MAKKKSGLDTKTIVLIGLGVYLLTRNKNNNSGYNQPPTYNYPPPPPRQTPQWAQWAQLVVSTAGNVASLWQPGGPFYNEPDDEIFNATGYSPPDIYSQDYENGAWV